MARTIIREIKKEGQRKAKRRTHVARTKKKEKVNPFRGRKLFHPWPF
jgi:hypothetical protein